MTTKKAKIFYIHPCDIRATRKEKFDYLQSHKFQDIPFEQITPDKNNNWINLTDNDFDTLLPLCSKEVKEGKIKDAIFKMYSNGVMTDRDDWVYDFSEINLINKINYFSEIYNNHIDNNLILNETLNYSIKWSRDLKNKLKRKLYLKFDKNKITFSIYRPFCKLYFYCDKIINDVITENHFETFGKNIENYNQTIAFTGLGSTSNFASLASKYIFDRNYYSHIPQFVPLFIYDKTGNRIENITDWGLEQFKKNYELENGKEKFIIQNSKFKIQKEDIFHYVYGVLHNPAYRKKYELNLKREFPRIPFYNDFWKWAAWGKELMDLHINYETVEPYELKVMSEEFLKKGKKEVAFSEDFIPKAKLKAVDELTTIKGIPKEAWEYKLGIRSAIEWVLDQYKESTPSDLTIKEKFNTYKFADYKDHVIDLLKRVVTVSVKTMEIVKQMETEESTLQP